MLKIKYNIGEEKHAFRGGITAILGTVNFNK